MILWIFVSVSTLGEFMTGGNHFVGEMTDVASNMKPIDQARYEDICRNG